MIEILKPDVAREHEWNRAGAFLVSPALIVVHGIGTQRPGETLLQCARGLLSVCAGAELVDTSGAIIAPEDITARGLDRVSVRQGGLNVRLCEVYWADLLPDEAVQNTFDKFDFEETTWFPLLNWRAGLLPRDEYPAWLITLRTAELWFLQVMMSLALEILIAIRRVRSTVLDRTAADVWHYVHSLAGELAPGSPLTGSSEKILDRLQKIWEEAANDGPVHLIGHSLGSVIAYHGITRRLPAQAIRRLITVGSPLEKTRFLWAKLFPLTFDWSGEWLNYLSPSDPVSGRLKRFDARPDCRVRNIRLWGLGGYGEAHVGYFRDPRVMSEVAAGLGARVTIPGSRSAPSWFRRRTLDVAVPLLMLLLVILGAAVTVAFFYAVIWITGALLALLVGLFWPSAAPTVAHVWRVAMGWFAGFLWILFTTKDGFNRAVTRHARRWR